MDQDPVLKWNDKPVALISYWPYNKLPQFPCLKKKTNTNLLFYNSEIGSAFLLEALEKSIFLPFPAFKGKLHYLVSSLFLYLQNQQHSTFKSLFYSDIPVSIL